MHIHTHIQFTHTSARIHISHARICKAVHVCVACMPSHVAVCIHPHVHTRVHTRMHAHTPTNCALMCMHKNIHCICIHVTNGRQFARSTGACEQPLQNSGCNVRTSGWQRTLCSSRCRICSLTPHVRTPFGCRYGYSCTCTVYIHMHVHVQCMSICMYMYMYVYMYMYMYVHMCIYICIYVNVSI